MKSKILLLFLMFAGLGSLYAQPKFKLRIEIFGSKDVCPVYNSVFFSFRQQNVAVKTFSRTGLSQNSSYVFPEYEFDGTINNTATLGFNINTTFQGGNSCFGYNTSRSDYPTDIVNIYKAVSYWTTTYRINPTLPAGYPDPGNDHGYAKVTIYPSNLSQLNVTSATTLLENEKINLNATVGFPADAYKWKYQINNGTWVDFPKYQGVSDMAISGSELLGSNFQSIAASGAKVLVAVFAKDYTGNDILQGEVRVLYPQLYAPKIVSVTSLQTKCYGDNSTTAIIKFDKKIGDNESIELLCAPIGSGDVIQVYGRDIASDGTYLLQNLLLNKAYKARVLSYFNEFGEKKNSIYYFLPVETNYTTDKGSPPQLQTRLNSTGIYCFGGKDGALTGGVKGGTSPYKLTYQFNGQNQSPVSLSNGDVNSWINDGPIQNLSAGSYTLAVIDNNGCIAALQTAQLPEPSNPYTIVNKTATDATGFGLSTGSIQLKTNGGTIANTSVFANGYYAPVLKDSIGKSYVGVFDSRVNEVVTYNYAGLPAGKYTVRAEDMAIYGTGTSIRDSAGCLAKDIIRIYQPPVIQVNITERKSIDCFSASTGIIAGDAKGGVPLLDSVFPYSYQWSYAVDGLSPYKDITYKDTLVNNRPSGYYKLTATDKNGISKSSVYALKQPTQVNYDLSVKNVTCLNWTDGAVVLSNERGGTKPYSISWHNNSNGTGLQGLGAGTYEVKVSDSLNCSVTKSYTVKDTLNEIEIKQRRVKAPHCYNDCDAELSINVNAESLPYTLKWTTGSEDTLLTGICAGNYKVQIYDSKNCLKEATFVVPNTPEIALDLGEESRYLCTGQKLDFDIAVADSNYQYQWVGTSLLLDTPKITIANPGQYTAIITDQKGCKALRNVYVSSINKTVEADFVVPTQVFSGEEVSIVNITKPAFADTSYWELNQAGIAVKELRFEYATVVFQNPGVYEIGLRSKQDKCLKLVNKQVIVTKPDFEQKPYNAAQSFIEEFEIMPNPSNGYFKVKIKLQDVASVKLKFMDFISKTVITEAEGFDANEYLIQMNVQVAPATYILFLETPYGTRVLKVVVL